MNARIFRRFGAALLCAVLAALPARAHPHIFIDAGLTFLFDESGKLSAVKVLWIYDDFTSLMMVEDKGLDADGDGALTDAEKAALAGHDVDWEAGFPGDLTLSIGAVPVALARPVEQTADYMNGRIITSHIRPLETAIDLAQAGPLVVKVFDPTYFVYYDVTKGVTASREGCSISREQADTPAATALMDKLVSTQDFALDSYPEIGEAFADTFILTCAASS